MRDLNPRLSACKADTLAAELIAQIIYLVVLATTYESEISPKKSNGLSKILSFSCLSIQFAIVS